MFKHMTGRKEQTSGMVVLLRLLGDCSVMKGTALNQNNICSSPTGTKKLPERQQQSTASRQNVPLVMGVMRTWCLMNSLPSSGPFLGMALSSHIICSMKTKSSCATSHKNKQLFGTMLPSVILIPWYCGNICHHKQVKST